MAELGVVRRYGRALFDVARKQQLVDQVRADLQQLDQTLKENPRLGRAEFHLHPDSEYKVGAGGTAPAQIIQRSAGKFSFLSCRSPYSTAPLATWVCDFSTR